MKEQMVIALGAVAFFALPLTIQAVAQSPKPQAKVQFVSEQPTGQWLARVFLGSYVMNSTGERVGDINDLVFDRTGQISTVVIGVGGFLGLGEKNVAVPYSALTFDVGTAGARVITVAVSKDALKAAPAFSAIEKTTMDTVKDKAIELKDQAIRKFDDMKGAPVKP